LSTVLSAGEDASGAGDAAAAAASASGAGDAAGVGAAGGGARARVAEVAVGDELVDEGDPCGKFRVKVLATAGRGGFGQVLKVLYGVEDGHRLSDPKVWGNAITGWHWPDGGGKPHAAKVARVDKQLDRGARAQLREAVFLAYLPEHANVMPYRQAFFAKKALSVVIVMDFAAGGCARGRVEPGALPPPSLEWVLDISIQLARGLAHVHHNGIVHQDVSPANTLLFADPCPDQPATAHVAKLADFGVAGGGGGGAAKLDKVMMGPAAVVEGEKDRLARAMAMSLAPEGVVTRMRGCNRKFCSPEQRSCSYLTTATDIFSWAKTVEFLLEQRACAATVALPDALDALLRRARAESPVGRPTAADCGKELEIIFEEACGHQYARAPAPPTVGSVGAAKQLNNLAGALWETKTLHTDSLYDDGIRPGPLDKDDLICVLEVALESLGAAGAQGHAGRQQVEGELADVRNSIDDKLRHLRGQEPREGSIMRGTTYAGGMERGADAETYNIAMETSDAELDY
jgi:hypothetical protein